MFGTTSTTAQQGLAGALARLPRQQSWDVDGVRRQAMVAVPESAKTKPTPVVFVFHGHGGKMRSVLWSYGMHRRWPEAIVVYPQGLNTPGVLSDPDGKRPGWQSLPGNQSDRDLKFFDTVLANLKKDYKVDARRIYATGHSNGAAFTYLLWAMRGKTLAAVAPSAGAIRPELRTKLKPKPTIILAGQQDRLVKYQWQAESIEFVRKLNQCNDQPTRDGLLRSYASKVNMPLQTYIYPGGHKFASDGVPAIVSFFKSHALSSQHAPAENATEPNKPAESKRTPN